MAQKGISASRQPPNVVDDEEEEEQTVQTKQDFTKDEVLEQIALSRIDIALDLAIMFAAVNRMPQQVIDSYIMLRVEKGLDITKYQAPPQPK